MLFGIFYSLFSAIPNIVDTFKTRQEVLENTSLKDNSNIAKDLQIIMSSDNVDAKYLCRQLNSKRCYLADNGRWYSGIMPVRVENGYIYDFRGRVINKYWCSKDIEEIRMYKKEIERQNEYNNALKNYSSVYYVYNRYCKVSREYVKNLKDYNRNEHENWENMKNTHYYEIFNHLDYIPPNILNQNKDFFYSYKEFNAAFDKETGKRLYEVTVGFSGRGNYDILMKVNEIYTRRNFKFRDELYIPYCAMGENFYCDENHTILRKTDSYIINDYFCVLPMLKEKISELEHYFVKTKKKMEKEGNHMFGFDWDYVIRKPKYELKNINTKEELYDFYKSNVDNIDDIIPFYNKLKFLQMEKYKNKQIEDMVEEDKDENAWYGGSHIATDAIIKKVYSNDLKMEREIHKSWIESYFLESGLTINDLIARDTETTLEIEELYKYYIFLSSLNAYYFNTTTCDFSTSGCSNTKTVLGFKERYIYPEYIDKYTKSRNTYKDKYDAYAKFMFWHIPHIEQDNDEYITDYTEQDVQEIIDYAWNRYINWKGENENDR